MDEPPADTNAPSPSPRHAPKPRQDRLAREAAALRANLRKRKEQARERASAKQDPDGANDG